MSNFCIKDPIYNEINFSDDPWALELLKTKEFKRLQNINQLGISNKIFPSATNSRFSHSIGTYEIAKKFSKHLLSKFSITNYESKLFLATSLLHDIGHGPLSHVFESITNIDHESITKKIILDPNLQIYKILNEFKIKPEDVVSVLSNSYEKKWLSTLISSNLDVDRIDYMFRDAYFLGTNYSKIDINFLVDRTYIINDILLFSAETINMIESFLLGRYYMHCDIYDNLNTYSYEWSLKMIFIRLKEISKEFELFKKEIYFFNLYSWIVFQETLSNDIFIQLNDYNLDSFLSSLTIINDKVLNSFISYFQYGNFNSKDTIIEIEYFSKELENKLSLKADLSEIDPKYLFFVFKKSSKDYYSLDKKNKIILFNEKKKEIFEFPYNDILEFKKDLKEKKEKLILINRKNFF